MNAQWTQAKCAPLAALFADEQAQREVHTLRNMRRLCYSCPLFQACGEDADVEMAQYEFNVAKELTFRAGQTALERRRRLFTERLPHSRVAA